MTQELLGETCPECREGHVIKTPMEADAPLHCNSCGEGFSDIIEVREGKTEPRFIDLDEYNQGSNIEEEDITLSKSGLIIT